MATTEQVEFYNMFLEHFETQVDNPRNVGFRSWVRKWIYAPKKVLDFGCAYGYNSQYLIHEVGCEVFGVDLSPKCIEVANERFPRGRWFAGDITEGFDIGERDFDFVLMSDVIEHVPLDRHQKVFEVLSEWVRPGGAIILSVPNPLHYEDAQKQTQQPVEELVDIPVLMQNMQNVGFSKFVSLFLWEEFYYRMIVQKV